MGLRKPGKFMEFDDFISEGWRVMDFMWVTKKLIVQNE